MTDPTVPVTQEAPERIWLLDIDGPEPTWCTVPETHEESCPPVEYIRADRIAHQPTPVEGDEVAKDQPSEHPIDAILSLLAKSLAGAVGCDVEGIDHSAWDDERAAISGILSQVCAAARREGMEEAARICGTLAETTYDDADGFQAATGCEAAIRTAIEQGAPATR